MIDHSSDRRFSTGVPVSATRWAASNRRTARAGAARLFFTAWASSSTRRRHPTAASASASRVAVA